jgi:FixJ family two-component response regulator
MRGLELQQELMNRRQAIPTILITAHATEDVTTRDMTHGAVNCLPSPFSEESLLKAIKQELIGLDRSRASPSSLESECSRPAAN